MYLHTPVLEVGSWWRVDTASGTNTPTTVYAHDGADAIPTALGASGSTVRDSTRDGTGLFWSTAATLYCKELTYQGVPTGTVVTSTGVTPTTPSGAPVDIAAITATVAALPTTYAPIAAAPVASSATSGTLTASAEHNLTPTSAAAWTLPTGVTASKLPTTVKNNGTAAVTVARGGSDTINGGTASVSIAAGEWARFTSNGAGAWTQSGTAGQSNTKFTYDVREYGAVLDGVADDTAAIQSAINAAAAAGGGIVQITGHGNTRTRVSQLGIRAFVTLRGTGPGSTQIVGTSSSLDVITLDESQGSVSLHGVWDLQIRGGRDCIHFTHTTNSNFLSYGRGSIRNVVVAQAARNGIWLDAGCQEYRMENCLAKVNGGFGFRVDGSDHFITLCTSQGNGGDGIKAYAGNALWSNTKSFGNTGKGWLVAFRQQITSSQAQENLAGGWEVSGSDVVLTGCMADSDGGIGFDLLNAQGHVLTGCKTLSWLSQTHTAGFRIATGGTRGARLVGCSSNDTVPLDAASDTSGCTVDINGSGGGAASLLDQGSWVASTVYAVSDVVTQAGQRYACRVAHTSGTFATDLAATKWIALDAVAAAASVRTVTAGTGLTGGGDLTADRTLTVAYGTTSGTAAQGNDSRITGALQAASNLSDVANAGTSRTNLGLGTAATQASTAFDAAGAATAAQNASLQKTSNLSDLNSAATARTNLGLGTAATQASTDFDTAGAAATVQAASLQKTSNLSDVANVTTSRANLGAAQDATRTAVKTTSYTAAAGDLVPVDTTSGNVTITLPTAPADKSRITVKHIVRGGTNTVTIATGGSDVFNAAAGATTLTLTLALQAVTAAYNASTAIWTVVSDDLALSQLDARYDAAGAAASAQTASLQKTSNLSDLASPPTARTNLGLGTAATLASSAVAQTANNLSDLADAPTARTNLGLGTAATLASSAVAQTSDVQTFTANGTWTMPSGAKLVEVICIAGGGGGGGGRKGAAGSNRYGGSSGAGGGYSRYVFTASGLTSTVAVTVGGGGTSGASATSSDASGGNGGDGGTSTFGSYLRSTGGQGGIGGLGTSSGQVNATAGVGNVGASGAGSFTAFGAGAGVAGGNGAGGPAGGGSGSGITSGDAANTGGSGGLDPYGANVAAAHGAAGNGGTSGGVGSGAGGGNSSTSGAAESGGNGGSYGGGAGGGGAGVNSVGNSGAGGVGGGGIVRVTTLF